MSNIGEVETTETEKSSGINWGKVLEADRENGLVNLDATMERLRIEAELFVESNEQPMSAIAAATAAAFAKKKVDVLRMGSLTSRAVLELDIPVESEGRVEKRIANFVQGESAKFVETEGSTGSYHVRLGRHGGIHLVNDAYRAAYKASLAAK